ncbi:hypothetical protein [Lysobacter sp. A3-1-A15]|uniref:hypothetical protein n=1 Tax=Novilysobacter viscosus TaxID=3098602 RepID=UPI002ED79C7E
MKTLSQQEVNAVEGGIIPAIAAGFMAYNYVVAVYSATQIATGVGIAVGTAVTIAAAQD